MSWIRGQSSDYLDLSNDVLSAILGTSVLTVGISSGGTGYTVGDILTIAGGTSAIAAQIEVTSVAAGVIDGVRIYNAGNYSVAPSSPNSATGGTGSTASLTLTTGTKGWTQDLDAVWDGGTNRQVIIHGNGGGSDAIYVGWRTFDDGGTSRYNWELHGMTGYSSGQDINQQPGVSPGDHESGTAAVQYGAYLPLQNSTMNWFMSVDSYRIILTVNVGSNYYHAYMGFINRFATTTEYPYPLVVGGSSNWVSAQQAQVEKMSTLTDPWSHASLANNGPMLIRNAAGSWISVANSTINGGSRNSASVTCGTLPCGTLTAATSSSTPEQDRFVSTTATLGFGQFIEQSDLNPPDGILKPTDGTADSYILFPTTIVQSVISGEQNVFGELDDVFWLRTFGASDLANEDRIIYNSEVYRVFQNCNRTGNWEFLAVREV